MSRLIPLLFAVLLLALPTASASATPSPARAQATPFEQASDDETADPADEADPGDSADDEDTADTPLSPAEVAALCAALVDEDLAAEEEDPADDDEADPANAAEEATGDDPQLVDDPSDEEDDSSSDPGDDLETLCAQDPPNEAADGGTLTVGLTGLLRDGVLHTGTVDLAGPGTVTQELWLPAPNARASAASARTAARKHRAVGGPILAGTVTRTLRQAGVAHLGVQLNGAARRQLRSTRRDVRITVRTVTRVRGSRPRARRGTVIVSRRLSAVKEPG